MRKEFEFERKRLIFDIIHTQEDFFDFINSLRLDAPFIVKPNWISRDHCHFTDPQILEWVLRSLHKKGEVVLVESYSVRNMATLHDIKPGLTLTTQERERVRESEKDFLKETGTKSVIEELGLEYVNVAEEVLEGRVVEEETVREHVERSYSSVLRDELYGFLPEKLYELRGGTFVSLAKFKIFFTMCTKNMFGLIPEYVGYGSRLGTYHGKANMDLSQNIVDINKVYRSIFHVVGLVEGVNGLSYNIGTKTGKQRSGFGYRYDVLEDKGLIYYCADPLWLDAFVHQQCGKPPNKEAHLELAANTFGRWPPELLRQALKMGFPTNENR